MKRTIGIYLNFFEVVYFVRKNQKFKYHRDQLLPDVFITRSGVVVSRFKGNKSFNSAWIPHQQKRVNLYGTIFVIWLVNIILQWDQNIPIDPLLRTLEKEEQKGVPKLFILNLAKSELGESWTISRLTPLKERVSISSWKTAIPWAWSW